MELTYNNVYYFCTENEHILTDVEFDYICAHFYGYDNDYVESNLENYILESIIK